MLITLGITSEQLGAGPGLAYLLAGTFAYCVGSGLIPVLNAEVFLLAVAAASPRGAAVPIVLVASIAQMLAKIAIFQAGRGIVWPLKKREKEFAAVTRKLRSSRVGSGGFVFISSLTGIPPFYVVSIVAGTVRIPFVIFLLPGLAGRLVRFGLVVFFPQLFKSGG